MLLTLKASYFDVYRSCCQSSSCNISTRIIFYTYDINITGNNGLNRKSLFEIILKKIFINLHHH